MSQRHGVEYRIADRPVVGFCSNDYLGLAPLPMTRQDGPSGAGASRLICGDLASHRDVEATLAAVNRTEDAVLFPSGFQLNVGVLPALVREVDTVHSDRLNHASIIDGLRLSPAKANVLPHGVAPAVPTTTADHGRLQWWITESIFSMDGDRVDTAAMAEYQRRGGTLYVDEAHAFGLFAHGGGLLHAMQPRPDVLVGTLSKAYGCAAAFVAASQPICQLIRNRARSFVFSTGVAPTVVADIAARLQLLRGQQGDQLRAKLWANVRRFDVAFHGSDPATSAPPSPIFPILVGDNAPAMAIAARLLERGIHVQAIRPPTVPSGTARLRVTISAEHSTDQIEWLATELRTAMAQAEVASQHPGPNAARSANHTSKVAG